MGRAKSILLLFVFVAIAGKSYSQVVADTLKEIKVHGRHKEKKMSADERVNTYSPGQKVKTIDSITLQQYQMQSLANLLSQQVPVFVKSYGFNSLATLNFRGSSSAQSAVLWNGVPIQNAALGIADVSTLPVLFMNKVNVVYGGSSALWGSGNVGGALLLENDDPVFDTNRTTLSLSGGAGSFGQYMGGLKSSFSSRKWFLSANVFAQTALNDFPYTNAGVDKTTNNAHLQSGAVYLQSAYKIDAQNVIGISAWYQQYQREIPAALFEQYSAKKQDDGSLKLLLDWNRHTASTNWYAKASFIQDYIHYQDDAISLVTRNTTNQYFQEVGWNRTLSEHSKLLLFTPIQISWMDVASVTKYQQKYALAGAYRYAAIHDRLNVAINARGETINQQSIFLPGADASFAITRWLSVRANVQRTYRAPTLNELYFFPGGDSTLRPEQGWNEDVGYTVKLKTNSLTISHDVSVFNRLIKDWIIWFGGAIWTPHNIAEVNSRGIETDNTLEWKVNNRWRLHLGVNTSYIVATTQSSYILNDGSIGKQIPYTPRYNAQFNVGFTYRNFYLNYNHTYTGYRYITTDESEYIDPYNIGSLQFMYSTVVSGHTLQLTAQCNNIFDDQYQVVASRPMPGINWLAGVKIYLIN